GRLSLCQCHREWASTHTPRAAVVPTQNLIRVDIDLASHLPLSSVQMRSQRAVCVTSVHNRAELDALTPANFGGFVIPTKPGLSQDGPAGTIRPIARVALLLPAKA